MNKAESILLQKQIAERGVIVGNANAVAELLGGILYHDTRFRGIGCQYGPLAPGKQAKEGKEPGTPYSVVGTGRGPVKGVRTEEEQARRTVPNNLLTVYCVDAERRAPGTGGWRTLNTNLIQWFEVYTGRTIPNPAKPGKMKAQRIAVPVRIIQ